MEKNVEHLKTVAVDGVPETASKQSDFCIKDEDFDALVKFRGNMCKQ